MKKQIIKFSCVFSAVAALVACGGGGGGDNGSASNTDPTPYFYATTSSKGDYSTWEIRGSHLDAVWQKVQPDGDIAFATQISATCSAEDSFGVRSCTIDSTVCTDAAATCPATGPTGSFNLREVPGVALYAEIASITDPQLHLGFAMDATACTQDVSGDYTSIRTGLGVSENFGMYRSDTNFENVMHADFGFDTADANLSQTLAYRTFTESESLFDYGCFDGLRIRQLSGGIIARSMITDSGLFVMDLPAGQGGLLSFRTENAATLADFAGKSFGGISYPDNDTTKFVNADFSVVSGNQISFNVEFSDGPTGILSLMPLTAASSVTDPAYPDFTTAPAGYGSSALASAYATPANIPGLFKLDNLPDSGRVILAAMIYNSKVIAMGMVYNYRTTGDINPGTGTNFPADGLYNTGNFLLFEK